MYQKRLFKLTLLASPATWAVAGIAALGAAMVKMRKDSEAVIEAEYCLSDAEKEAIEGALETIEKHRPALMISLYHRSEDIFEIPLYISENYPQYDLYLRRTECLPAWEINLCAVKK